MTTVALVLIGLAVVLVLGAIRGETPVEIVGQAIGR